VWGYTDAGKTGTADKAVEGHYNPHYVCASFIGIVPADSPAFILIVTMDEPEYTYLPGIGKNHHGGVCSAPVFREIAAQSLEYLGIAPDDPYGYPVGDPRHDSQKADWLKEVRDLQDLYKKWNK
jgi:cell division protein FtsI (penicillin-binding protein 3)